MLIKLSYWENREIKAFVGRAQSRKVAHKVQTKKFDPNHSDTEVQLIGMKGEFAVGKWLGIKPDLNAYIGGGEPNDFQWQGLKVEVKTGRYRPNSPSDLIVTSRQFCDSDIFVRCTTDLVHKAVRINGWIETVDFLRLAEIRNFGYGDRMVVRASDLHNPETLQSWRANSLDWDDIASKQSSAYISPGFMALWRLRALEQRKEHSDWSEARIDLYSAKELIERWKDTSALIATKEWMKRSESETASLW